MYIYRYIVGVMSRTMYRAWFSVGNLGISYPWVILISKEIVKN